MLHKYDFLSIIIYPDLIARKLFVHDAWVIAKYTECYEFKMTVINDKFFYITRDDIFQLIHSDDDEIIDYMLKIEVKLEL